MFPMLSMLPLKTHPFSQETSSGTAQEWYESGRKLSRIGEHAAAIESYRKALNLEPDHYEVLYCYAVSLASLGRDREARVWDDRVLAIQPDHREAWYAR